MTHVAAASSVSLSVPGGQKRRPAGRWYSRSIGPPSHPSFIADHALVARAREGDLAAAGELLTCHQRLAYTAALRLLGQPAEAEDVAQDALVRAYTHLADLQQGEDFAPWLRRIAVNLSLNVLRRRGRLRFESLDEPPTDSAAAPGSGAPPREFADEGQRSPEDEALGAVLRADVEALVRRLPNEQRVAVVLRDIYGYDVAEVAVLQGCGLSAAKMRVSRGRAALRHLLETAGVLQAGETSASGDASGVGR